MESAAPMLTEDKRKNRLTGWLYQLKDWTEALADRPYAVAALFVLAFLESSVFPIPPDVLLIALCVGRPRRSFYFALVSTVGSVLGGLAGYGIGYWLWYDSSGAYAGIANFFFNHIPGFSIAKFQQIQALYDKWNFWVVFTAGFTPIPYKIITVSAGVFKINAPMFILASIVGRAGRFFLVGGLFYLYGPRIKRFLEDYLEILTVAFIVLLLGGFVLIKYVL
jgi:membrane protein YqaA with SNARE-associated domain